MCFVRPECFAKLSSADLLKLDLSDNSILLTESMLFLGTETEGGLKPTISFVSQAVKAYQETGKYIQTKFPLNNMILRDLSAVDPAAIGHSLTMRSLTSLLDRMPYLFTLNNGANGTSNVKTSKRLRIAKP